MKKYRLLNNGGYVGLEDVEFPVEVTGFPDPDYDHLICVLGETLIKLGADPDYSHLVSYGYLWDSLEGEIQEVIEND